MKSFQKILDADGKAIVITMLEGIESDADGIKSLTSFEMPYYLAFPGSLKSYIEAFDRHSEYLSKSIGSLEIKGFVQFCLLVISSGA